MGRQPTRNSTVIITIIYEYMAFQFAGFSVPNGTFVPDEVFDILAPELTEAELRVLLYIIRRTFGFKKDQDNISLKQMTAGIRTRDGKVLDRGTGLSKAGNARGIRGLVEKRIIVAKRNRSVESGDQATTYALRFKEPAASDQGGGKSCLFHSAKQPAPSTPPTQGRVASERTVAPVSMKTTGGCLPRRQGGVYHVDTQETELQQTDFNHSNIRKQHAAHSSIPGQAASPAVVSGASRHQEKQQSFLSVSTVLSQMREPAAAPALPESEARDAIRAYIKDIAPRFNDQARLESSVGRAYHLYLAANLPLGAFLSRLLEVSSTVRERQSKVKKRANGGRATMPYYFACLEDHLGLRKPGRNSHPALPECETGKSTGFSPASASSLAGEQGGNSPPPHTHSFAHPHAQGGCGQSGQSSEDARSASAAPS